MARIYKSNFTELRETLSAIGWLSALEEGDIIEQGDERWLVVGIEAGGYNELGGCRDVIIAASHDLVRVEVPCSDIYYHWWARVVLCKLPLPPEGLLVRWSSERWGEWTPVREEVVTYRWSGDPPRSEEVREVDVEEG